MNDRIVTVKEDVENICCGLEHNAPLSVSYGIVNFVDNVIM
ncbi:hypothetical protein [Xenorhabdus sp. Sc-CR9]|nr:hypothetical protein [Xenorhabdus sp. Sc-CR9]